MSLPSAATRLHILRQPSTLAPSSLESIYAFPNTLDARLWTLDSAFRRRSPGPGRRRFEEILSVAEEVALVWGLRYCMGVASWEEAARDEGRELSDRSAQDISRSPLDSRLSTLRL